MQLKSFCDSHHCWYSLNVGTNRQKHKSAPMPGSSTSYIISFAMQLLHNISTEEYWWFSCMLNAILSTQRLMDPSWWKPHCSAWSDGLCSSVLADPWREAVPLRLQEVVWWKSAWKTWTGHKSSHRPVFFWAQESVSQFSVGLGQVMLSQTQSLLMLNYFHERLHMTQLFPSGTYLEDNCDTPEDRMLCSPQSFPLSEINQHLMLGGLDSDVLLLKILLGEKGS